MTNSRLPRMTRLLLLAAIVVATPCVQYATTAEAEDVTTKDYSKELPRIKPVPLDKALDTFSIAPGVHAELAAHEPTVVDPVAMAFDEDGNLFVIEMRGYSEQAGDMLGRVRRLVDTDGDGVYETSTVYADGLSWPTAIIYYDGGVFVGAAPDIWYFKDTDGDGQADDKDKIFTGFGKTNVQGLLNSFNWGLDNRIHGATSSSGGTIKRVGDDKSPPLNLRGRDFAFDPKTLEMTAESGGAQHGMSFNDWGDKFVCSNSDHLQMTMFEERYIARNPYLAVSSPRVSIAADGPQADVFRASPVEPWRIVRTRLRVSGAVPGAVERGGKAAGYFTGATGSTIYRGDALGNSRSMAIVGDAGGNLVHRKKLVPDGLLFHGQRVDEKSELFASNDIWFRPVQFANGPDGALYIADMHRETIEHPKSIPSMLKKHLDLTSGRDRGRIYRLVDEDYKRLDVPKMSASSTTQLVAALDDPNGWTRDTASRLLFERADAKAIPQLRELLAKGSPQGRLHALYALDQLNALTPDQILKGLDDEHPRVRQHAIRLCEPKSKRLGQSVSDSPRRTPLLDDPAIAQKLYSMIEDSDPHVRYQLAYTLGDLGGPRRDAALAKLIANDGEERWMRIALASSLTRGAGPVLAILARRDDSPNTKYWIKALASQIGRQQRPEDVAAVLTLLGDLSKQGDTETARHLVRSLSLKPNSPFASRIASVTGGNAEAWRRDVLAKATKAARDTSLGLKARVAAIHELSLGSLAETRDLLLELLDPRQPGAIQQAALETLATFNDPDVGSLLVERWSSLSPSLRASAANVLVSRTTWVKQLLAAVTNGDIGRGNLPTAHLRILAQHTDADVREQASKLLEGVSHKRKEVVDAYRATLNLQGDATKGEAVFTKHCQSCHRVAGKGHVVGPSLAAMVSRGPEAILMNVLDPNREVNPQFLSYVLSTEDGEVITGMIGGETATSVTLQRGKGESDTVLRIDIDEFRGTGMSLMPEGLEKEIDHQAMADLIAYLQQAATQ
ncbi:Cytochrome c [Planctomycetes bacterium Pan216]|uniref:Cytochrome c n=1 Tax=Kolteria novifilia TaxID=2527975 RepID=A0A518B9D4_9BACT|nr:Cytochrome c [Planctomycetes bacterium Pan216]